MWAGGEREQCVDRARWTVQLCYLLRREPELCPGLAVCGATPVLRAIRRLPPSLPHHPSKPPSLPVRPGSLLVLPAGVYKPSAEGKELNTAYVYARGKWAAPIMRGRCSLEGWEAG